MDASIIPVVSSSLTLVCASVLDMRERRVPNWLTYGSALCAIGYQAFAGSLMSGLVGALACAVIGIVMYALSRLGAGDAKLLMAIGGWLGPGLGLDIALITLVLGAVIGLVLLVRAGLALRMMRELWLCALTLATSGSRVWVPAGELTFPLAPVMAVSALIVTLAPGLRPFSPLLEALS